MRPRDLCVVEYPSIVLAVQRSAGSGSYRVSEIDGSSMDELDKRSTRHLSVMDRHDEMNPARLVTTNASRNGSCVTVPELAVSGSAPWRRCNPQSQRPRVPKPEPTESSRKNMSRKPHEYPPPACNRTHGAPQCRRTPGTQPSNHGESWPGKAVLLECLQGAAYGTNAGALPAGAQEKEWDTDSLRPLGSCVWFGMRRHRAIL
jgi:hypothetical protein